jgi:hypothetical protein
VISRKRIKQVVDKVDAGGVLVTRVVGSERNVEITPGYVTAPVGMGFYGWYGAAWTAVPPDISEYNVVTIESTANTGLPYLLQLDRQALDWWKSRWP